jgi:hypothetical protein
MKTYNGREFKDLYDEGDVLCRLAQHLSVEKGAMVSDLWNTKQMFRDKYLDMAEQEIKKLKKVRLKLKFIKEDL